MAGIEFTDYLLSKREIDDCSLNQRVFARLRDLLSQQDRTTDPWFVEVGGGIGTMLERLVDWGVVDRGRYTLVDSSEATAAVARERLDGLFPRLTVEVITEDLHGVLSRTRSADMIIAHAVLDLVDPAEATRAIVDALAPGGLGYLTLNFDGETTIGPPHPADSQVIDAYHLSMSGDRHSGRHLLTALTALTAANRVQLVEAGSSDWVVFARDGGFSTREAVFLKAILQFFAASVPATGLVPEPVLAGWLESRQEQIASGSMTLIAHQLDFLIRKLP